MRAFILIAAFWTALASSAFADDAVTAGQAIIRSQTEAIGRDDAAAAYAFAAPAIQSIFPDARTFLNMVRSGYPAIYRHRSFQFGASKIEGGVTVQEVQIVDADGVAWAARYTLEQEPDGSLKISGCTLVKLTTA